MPNVVPSATWQPINYSGYPKRRKGRGAVAHVAVSNANALAPSGGNSWHFYLPKNAPAIQYVDLDYVAYAQLDGNPTMVSFESQGGVSNPDGEQWTDTQVEWAARIYAHLHTTEGSPLQVMPDSLPGSKGLGFHRLGIDPWRVAGGECWSSSRGKLCPGAAKIAQIPSIVARATQLASGAPQEDDLTPEQAQQLAQVHEWIRGDPAKTVNILQDILYGQAGVTEMLKGNNPTGQNNFHWLGAQLAGLSAAVQALAAAPGGLSSGEITAAAKAGADQALTALAERLPPRS